MIYWSIVVMLIGVLALFIPLGDEYFLRTLLMACTSLLLIVPCIETHNYAKSI